MSIDADLDLRIRNRRSWLQVLVIGLFAGIIAWKLLTGNAAFATIDFATLLSVLLSLFAIALSVAFYFKATDTSNTFYDNTYRFTKDISEILGRIEAGFGERLKHLDEGYSGLRESVARIPRDPGETQQALNHEEETIKRLEAEKAAVLDQLAERAKLQEAEKRQLFEQMEIKDRELRQVRAETASLRRRLLSDASTHSHTIPEVRGASVDEILKRVTTYTQHFAAKNLLAASTRQSEGAFRERFAELREALPAAYVEDLKALGFVSAENQLTDVGVRWIRRLARRASPPEESPPG